MAERAPQPGGVDQQVHPRTPGELLVPGGVDVADGGDGDVGVDVERGGAGRPVARAFLAGDGPPREGRAAQAQLGGPVEGQRQRGVPPPQRAGGRVGGGVGSAWAARRSRCPRTRARRNPGPVRPLAGIARFSARAPACSTWNSAKRTACCTSGSPSTSHVGAVPEVVQEGALLGEQPVPAGLPGRGQRRPHLVTDGRERPPARPAVGDELDHPQLLPRLQHRGHGDQAAVLEHPGLRPAPGPGSR